MYLCYMNADKVEHYKEMKLKLAILADALGDCEVDDIMSITQKMKELHKEMGALALEISKESIL